MGQFQDRQRMNSGRLGLEFATDADVAIGPDSLDYCQLGDEYARRSRDEDYETDHVYIRHLRISVDADNEWFSGVSRVKQDAEIRVVENGVRSEYIAETIRTATTGWQEIRMIRISRVSIGRKASGQ